MIINSNNCSVVLDLCICFSIFSRTEDSAIFILGPLPFWKMSHHVVLSILILSLQSRLSSNSQDSPSFAPRVPELKLYTTTPSHQCWALDLSKKCRTELHPEILKCQAVIIKTMWYFKTGKVELFNLCSQVKWEAIWKEKHKSISHTYNKIDYK